jgi:hypothetical protein
MRLLIVEDNVEFSVFLRRDYGQPAMRPMDFPPSMKPVPFCVRRIMLPSYSIQGCPTATALRS